MSADDGPGFAPGGIVPGMRSGGPLILQPGDEILSLAEWKRRMRRQRLNGLRILRILGGS